MDGCVYIYIYICIFIADSDTRYPYDTSHGIVTDRSVQPAFNGAFSVVCGRIGPLASERETRRTSTPVASIVSTPNASTVGCGTKGNKPYTKTSSALPAKNSRRDGFAMLARANLSECGD